MAKAPTLPPEFIERFHRVQANWRWANAHDGELQQHVWKFVAVDEERLLGVASSGQELRKKYKGRDALVVTQITPPDMAWILHGDS